MNNSTRQQQIEAFMTRHNVERSAPAGKGQTARSLRTLRYLRERELCGDGEIEFDGDPEVKEREVACAVRANGGSSSEALDAAREVTF